MKTRFLGKVLLIAILLLNIVMIRVMAEVPSTPHSADAMWVEPSSVVFDTSNASVGTKFNVTVWLNMTKDVFAYQIAMLYNRTQLKCTRAAFSAVTTSMYMVGHATTASGSPPVIDTSFLGNGSILASESCTGTDVIPSPNSGSLIWAEFQVLLVPTAGNLTSKFDITTRYNLYTWVRNADLVKITITTYDAAYKFIGPAGPAPPGPLSVSISPSSASVTVNQSLPFTSTVSGGTGPYGFQWFLNGSSVPGATSSSWVFSSTTNASYTVYLNVTDSLGATAKSNVALVTVTPPGALKHDVGIVAVDPARFWVYQNRTLDINVTLSDQGDYNETVTLTVYYNMTDNKKVGEKAVDINVGENKTVVFTWNASGVPCSRNYTIIAVATILSDSNLTDNTLPDGEVKVRMPYDVNGDGVIDGADIIAVIRYFGSFLGGPRWDADPTDASARDLNGDNLIDGVDLVLVARNFGHVFT
jgi:hypothetical protein